MLARFRLQDLDICRVVAAHHKTTMKAPPALIALTALILLPNQLSWVNDRSGLANSGTDSYGIAAPVREEIPTVPFCEMVKNPRVYFDKPVRVNATLGLATEGAYLSDEKCVLSHDDQIGVRFLSNDDTQRDLLNTNVGRIRSIEYGSRAKVTVVGILRNSSRRSFEWYRYRFDITRFEDISHVIVPYEGTLQAGITYRAAVRGDSSLRISLVIPLRMRNENYAVRIEWTNLAEFPDLKRLRDNSGEQQIVFSVIADKIQQISEQRWNRTLDCKIISIH